MRCAGCSATDASAKNESDKSKRSLSGMSPDRLRFYIFIHSPIFAAAVRYDRRMQEGGVACDGAKG